MWRTSPESPLGRSVPQGVLRLTLVPELCVLGFGFLLHLPWELWLSAGGDHLHLTTAGQLSTVLSIAALAHAGIAVLAFWVVAGAMRSRTWLRTPRFDGTALFVLASFLITLIAESLVTAVTREWEHATFLPTFVAPGLGYPSLLQALVVPTLLVGVVRRQLRGTMMDPGHGAGAWS